MANDQPVGTDIEGGFLTANSRELKKRIRATFATNFKRILLEKDLTQRDVCRETGMQPYEINKYATERLTPGTDKVEEIAKAIGVETDDLVPGYVTRSDRKRLGVRMVSLDSGNVWLEFSAAFDPEVANQILELISKNKIGEAPSSDA